FGRKFAWALAEYKHEDAAPFIKRAFDAADPEFAEPQVPAYDMKAIREALLDHALEQVTRDPELVQRMLVKGAVGLDNRNDEELIELYRSALMEEPPMIGNEASSTDDRVKGAGAANLAWLAGLRSGGAAARLFFVRAIRSLQPRWLLIGLQGRK